MTPGYMDNRTLGSWVMLGTTRTASATERQQVFLAKLRELRDIKKAQAASGVPSGTLKDWRRKSATFCGDIERALEGK